MNVSEAYKKYMTPKNLQEHMLRVSSLSKIICDNWMGEELDSRSVVIACALHDIAKPVNFSVSVDQIKKYNMSESDVANLENLKKFIKDKYGSDEHRASTAMCRDVGSDSAAEIIDNLEWSYIPRLMDENNMETLIAVYCDMRIGPKGILSLKDRFNDLKKRRGGDHDEYFDSAVLLEKKLQEGLKVDLNSISDEDLNSLFGELLGVEI